MNPKAPSRPRGATVLSTADSMPISTTIEPGQPRLLNAYRLALASVCVLLCLPVWATRYVPLIDYPNHLARVHILSRYEAVPTYRARYDRVIEPLPNLAMDAAMLPLLKVFEVETAGKVFLTATLLLVVFGCHLLGRAAHGGPSWLALPCSFLSYNSMLFFGFLNYLFGLGLFLVTFSAWLGHRGRWRAAPLAGLSLLACACYLAHLSAYAFLVLAAGVVACLDLRSGDRAARGLAAKFLPLALPLVLFRLFMGGSGTTGQIGWDGPRQKLVNSVSWAVTYNYERDILCACLVLVAALALAGRATGLRAERRVAAAAAAFALAFAASPETLFTSHSVDLRFAPAAAVLAIMSVRFNVPARSGLLSLSVVLAAACVRLGGVWYDWRGLDARIAAQVALFSHLPRGSSVYPLVVLPAGARAQKAERPLLHVIHYSTIERETHAPTLFALRGQQPLRFKREFSYYPFGLSVSAPLDVAGVDWRLILDNHDYLWGYNLPGAYAAFLKENCVLLAETGGGALFRVDHARAGRLGPPTAARSP